MPDPLYQGGGIVESFWTLNNALLIFYIAIFASITIYIAISKATAYIMHFLNGRRIDPGTFSRVAFIAIFIITPLTQFVGLPVAAALRVARIRHWVVFALLGTAASACATQWFSYWYRGDYPDWRFGRGALSGLYFGPPSAFIWWWTWRLGRRPVAPEA